MKKTTVSRNELQGPVRRKSPVAGLFAAGVGALVLAGGLFGIARSDDQQLTVSHPECVFFLPKGSRNPTNNTTPDGAEQFGLSNVTEQVARLLSAAPEDTAAAAGLPSVPGGSRTGSLQSPASNTIDKYIFQAISDAGVTPAPATTDFEFIRRATLDLTGRIPTVDRINSFVGDSSSDKRSKLVDELIAKPEWLDKWVAFFADLYQNNSRNTQIPRYIQGVTAFNTYIRTSLETNKPYDQLAREMIGAQGSNSYTQGELNFIVGGVVTGGPVQDVWDQQTVNTVDTFLGISHLNCLLCHNGRGHLDALSLWGAQTSRTQAWGMASFLARTQTRNTPTAGAVNGNPYYWSLEDNVRYKTDYPLNTTTGNRPPRQPVGTQTTVAPAYIFTGEVPKPGEDQRAAFGRIMTADFQFARATVNYMWEYFFGIGLVNPSNQFDPLRLDPDNPPSGCATGAPCTLQPSNPRLLNALAQDFINSKYDLKALMRVIVNSRSYQLSSRYNGTWNPQWQNLYARKFVRRLWAEEIHDAIVQSSNVVPTYTNAAWGPVSWAMQLPEPSNTPGGTITAFLDAFLRGNRDDQPRRSDGSISQGLSLMNDSFVMTRMRSNGPATSLLVKNLSLPDAQLVDTLFMNVLSRHPSSTEMSQALANLQTNRSQEAENLLWSLFNKVDFVFNY